MGLCFSKKKKEDSVSPPDDCKTEEKSPQGVVEEAAEKKRCETPVKKEVHPADGTGGVPVVPSVEVFTPVSVLRSSSCTREDEVDAILIQCGRLSRSSSANASAEAGASRRKFSGSKRSYDFDNERKGGDEEEGEWGEKSVSRPSPRRRRTPSRERSGSRERGGRRVSRSPGRRPELPASTGTCGDGSKQPVKMVVVPPRDKGRGVSPAASSKRGGETASVRSASPHPRSPATTRMSDENATCHPQLQSLSRSSLRNPMAEIDENTARASKNGSNGNKVEEIEEREEGKMKLSQTQSQESSGNSVQISKSLERNGSAAEFKNIAAVEKPSTQVSEGSNLEVESCHMKAISGAISSGDLDQIPGVNQEAFPSAPFSRAAFVSKAGDLSSTSSENNDHVADQSNHDDYRFDELPKKALPFVEPEVAVDDGLWQPNLHKYVTVRELRADVQPQESAGSNSFADAPWDCSSGWAAISADSLEGRQSSRQNDSEEVEQKAKPSSPSHQGIQQPVSEDIGEPEARGRRSRGGSSVPSNTGGHSATSIENKREPHRRAPPRRADSGGEAGRRRSSPLPTAAGS